MCGWQLFEIKNSLFFGLTIFGYRTEKSTLWTVLGQPLGCFPSVTVATLTATLQTQPGTLLAQCSTALRWRPGMCEAAGNTTQGVGPGSGEGRGTLGKICLPKFAEERSKRPLRGKSSVLENYVDDFWHSERPPLTPKINATHRQARLSTTPHRTHYPAGYGLFCFFPLSLFSF